MIKSAAVIALTLAASVYAQVPTGVSSSCSQFLNQLNGDQTINGCLGALINATSDFDPSTGSAATSSSASVQNTLNTICSNSFTSCPQTTIRSMLANFYTACQTDMLGSNGDGTNGRKDVIEIYDVLYLIIPLKNAMCTKDGNEYCVNIIANDNTHGASSSSGAAPSPSASGSDSAAAPNLSGTVSLANTGSDSASSSASSSAASPSASNHAKRSSLHQFHHAKRAVHPSLLYRRADNTTSQESLGDIAPSAEQYNQLGLPYLFITSNFTSDELCTTCTAEVVGAYISFESVTPYSLGIANSPMLSGQVELWNKIKECPNNFASQLLNNATGTGNSSGSLATVRVGFTQVVGALAMALLGGVMLF